MKTATTQENVVITPNDTLNELLRSAPAQAKACALAVSRLVLLDSAYGDLAMKYLERELESSREGFEGDSDDPDSFYASKWLAVSDALNMGMRIS